ncbi:MAG TPA: hypothetical protein VFB93_21090 [Burkholderiales bacterium]|nr:hypothetical protein [Burkholderiales bacterium]
MTTRPVSLLIGLLYLIASVSVVAAPPSKPLLEGTVSGSEVCPQSLCGNGAIFVGIFTGKVSGKQTSGLSLVQVAHASLNTNVGAVTVVTGGSWIIRTKRGDFAGTILGGQLAANDDDTFDVVLQLQITGTSTTLTFTGLLDHSGLDDSPPTIPTFMGNISQ